MVLKLIDKVKFLLRILSCVTVCTLTIIIGIQVVNRYVFGTSFTWVEELAGMAMVYITYFGAAMATINNSNTRIDFFIRKLPGPQTRKKSMPRCGSRNCTASALLRRIWLTQQQVRITSGLICMHAWPVKHGKKASRNWLLSLNWLPRLRLHMREGITSC